jgi:hypothetical protein
MASGDDRRFGAGLIADETDACAITKPAVLATLLMAQFAPRLTDPPSVRGGADEVIE